MKELASIQALRCLAAWMVFLHHYVQYFLLERYPAEALAFAQRGIFGVDIFFVISGFIMFFVTTRGGKVDSVQFLTARIVRIVPAYWFFTLLLLVAKALLPAGFTNTDWTVSSLGLSLLFVPVDNPGAGTLLPPLIVGWSLNLEMLFYVLLAAALMLGRPAGLAATAALCAVLAYAIPVPYGLMGEFTLGILLGVAWRRAPAAIAEIQGRPWIGASLLALGAAVLAAAPFHWRPLGAFLIVAGGLALEPRARRLGLAVLHMGDISYSTYLVHLIVLGAAYAVLGTGGLLHSAALLLLTAALTAVLSHVSHRYVERGKFVQSAHARCLHWLDRTGLPHSR